MKKTVFVLASFILLSLISCNDDDSNPTGNFTPSARIDKIVFTEIPIFTSTKPSDYNYFSIVTDFNSSADYSNEIINLKDASIYHESTGLINDLTFTYGDHVIEPNSSISFQTNILFGDSATNHINDLDNITNLKLKEIYQYDEATTFQKSYSIEMNPANTLVDNAEGFYNFTVYGTFIYE